MVVREERQEAQNSHDLELEFFVAHSFWERMQPPKQETQCNDNRDHDKGRNDVKSISFAGSRDEPRQVLRRRCMQHFSHVDTLIKKLSQQPILRTAEDDEQGPKKKSAPRA